VANDDKSCHTSQADDEDSRQRENIGGLSGRPPQALQS
jgi:hypothetical protein